MNSLSTNLALPDARPASWWLEALATCDLRRVELRSVQSNREFIRAWRTRRAASAYLPVFRRGLSG